MSTPRHRGTPLSNIGELRPAETDGEGWVYAPSNGSLVS
jgi:hypothetical protein